MKKIFTFILFVLITVSLYAQEEFSRAPLNPEFLKYVESLKAGKPVVKSYNNYYFGLIPSPLSPVTKSPAKSEGKSFPVLYDLREEGGVTSVKDQGQCGSCWAFGVMGSLESRWLLIGYGTHDLSEDNLNNCNNFDNPPCEGGNAYRASAMFHGGRGPMSEEDDPYSGPDDHTCPSGLTPVAYVTDCRWVDLPDQNVIKQAITDYGAMYMVTEFYFTAYNASDCTYFYNGTGDDEGGSHAMTLVGWDDDKVTAADKPGAWIVKNSWGEDWGDKGYVYMSYYDSVGIKRIHFFPERIDYNSERIIHQHDEMGFIKGYGFRDGEDKAAVKFTASSNQLVKTIGTYTTAPDAVLDIEIYDDFDGSIFKNLLGALRNQTCSYAGYYTFELDKPIRFYSGNDFFVKITYSMDYDYTIPMEKAYENYSSNAVISDSGSCWVSSSGSYWWPLGKDIEGRNSDVCIKACALPMGDSLIAIFSADRTSGIAPLNVQFTDHSNGNIETWSWDLDGDGSEDAASQNPSWEYDKPGIYDVTLIVSDGSDSDTLTMKNYIRVIEKLGYVWNLYSQSEETAEGPCILAMSGDLLNIDYNDFVSFSGADWANGRWYGCDYSTKILYSIDTVAGDLDTIASMNVKFPIGLAYDISTGKMFLSDLQDDNSYLYEVSLLDGYVDYIGEIVSGGSIIGLACDIKGNLYGLHLGENNLYKIDKETGQGMPVGDLGIDINYIQDIAFDRKNEILYGTLYEGSKTDERISVGPSENKSGGGLYKINLTSGAANLVAHFDDEVSGFAVPHDYYYTPDLEADFTADVRVGVAPLTVNFTDHSTGDIISREWDFNGDGIVDATGENPAYEYSREGIYTVSLMVEDASGIDTCIKEGYIRVVDRLGYGWIGYASGAYTTEGPGIIGTSGILMNIANNNGNFIAGADWVDGKWYGCRYSVNDLVVIDTSDGTITAVDTMNLNYATGLAYDLKTGKMFVSDYNGTGSDLYTIDLTDSSLSYVGEILSEALIIGIAFDNNGALYGISLDDDSLYTIDKATGKGTGVGDLGIDVNYAQDLAFDREDDVLYGTLYESSKAGEELSNQLSPGKSGGGLYKINMLTGAATLLGHFNDNVAGFAIPHNFQFSAAPEADFTADPKIGKAPLTVQFTDRSAGNITSWSWELDGDGLEDTTIQNPVYEYSKPGNYTVSLTVESESGSDTETKTDYIQVTKTEDCSWDFAASPYIMNFEEEDNLSGWSVIDGNYDGDTWEFDSDGGIDKSGCVVYRWSSYNSADDWLISRCFDLEANKDYELRFYYKVNLASLPEKLKVFYGNAADTSSMNNLVVDLGEIDNTSYLMSSSTVSISDSGTFYFGWYAYSDANRFNLYIDSVTIREIEPEQLAAEFSSDKTAGFPPLTVQFTDHSTGKPTSWSWDLNGDGLEDSITQHPVYEYTEPGSYTVSLTVEDESGSDTETKESYIRVAEKLGYAWNAYSVAPNTSEGPVMIDATGIIGNLNEYDGDFIAGADWVNGKWYGCQHSTNTLLTIDTVTGTLTSVGLMSLNDATGLAYDITGDKMFVSDNNGTGSDLYEVDLSDAVVTKIGEIVPEGIIIGLACSMNGTLYAINLSDDKLYTVDKKTGTGAIAGDLGFGINFAQDLAFDRKNEVLYGTLYESTKSKSLPVQSSGGKSGGGLYKIDTSSGIASLLGAFSDELCGFAIPHNYEYLEPITADFIADPIKGYAPLTVQFTDQSSGNINSWSWDFDNDGNIDATEQDPSHVYDLEGSYTVTLSVSDGIQKKSIIKTDYISVEVETSLDKLLSNHMVMVYPNPARDKALVSFREDLGLNRVELTAMGGEILSEWNKSHLDHNQLVIDVSKYPRGIYLLRILLKDHVITIRLIIE